MNKICKLTGKSFEISRQEQKLCESFEVPLPQISPEQRNRKRISYRNFINLYHKKCSETGQELLSMYKTESEYKVINNTSWWSADWNAKSFGIDLDPSQSLFDQYHRLDLTVPRMPIVLLNSENCDFSNMTLNSRSCYMVAGCVKSEDCIYGNIIWESLNCFDCLYAFQSQFCAHSIDIANCYEVFYSQESINCSNSYFLYDCRSCKDCFACYNLRNKQFCFMNQQLTKEEYEKKLSKYFPLSNSNCAKIQSWLINNLQQQAIHPEGFYLNSEEITGNHIYNCAELDSCFDVKRCERSSNLYTALDVEESSGISFTGGKTTFSLNSLTLAECEKCLASHQLKNCYDVAYSEFCYSSKHLFACNGLRNAEYCILNKQYSRDEFFKVRTEIINKMKAQGTYGEFFPEKYCPFTYNDSVASEYYELNESQAKNLGYEWEQKSSNIAKGIKAPDTSDWNESLLQNTYVCASSGKAFKYIKQELEFYKRNKLPLPLLCFKERHKARMKLRQPRVLSNRKCANCACDIKSAIKYKQVICNKCYETRL